MGGADPLMTCNIVGAAAVTVLDMNISQFLKSLGLEHLRDILEREQVCLSDCVTD